MVKAIYPLSVEGGCPKGRGLASFFAAKPPSLSLPPWGRGTASAVDRVLSLMAHLRRSPSSLSYRQYPIRLAPLATFPTRGRLCFGNTAIPIQPPPLRGTSFRRKENAAFPIANPFPRIVISSESEKSFSFAVRRDCEGSGERETCFMRLGEYGVSCRRLYEGKRKRGTKQIPRLRSG